MSNLLHYSSITDMPIHNFDVIGKTGDLNFLWKNHPSGLSKEQIDSVDLPVIWEIIYDEFIREFGLSETYQDWTRIRILAAKLYKQAYLDDKRYLITLAKAREHEAKELMRDIDGGDLAGSSAIISKFMGFRINVNEVSVSEFYAYLKIAKENGKKT